MLMENLIRRSGEEILYKLLLEWVSNNMPWLHTKQERDLEALVLHAMRIFENPEWVGYEVFRSNVARLRDQYPAGLDKEACS